MNRRALWTAVVCILLILAISLAICTIQSIAAGQELIDVSADIAALETTKDHAHEMADHARALGFKDSSDIIITAQQIWRDADGKIDGYEKLGECTIADLRSLTCAIYVEAGHRDTEMRTCVGSVVMNRVASSAWPNTIQAVLAQPGQYNPWYLTVGCMNNCLAQDAQYNYDYWGECEKIAKDCIMGLDGVPDNVIYQANFKQGSGVYKYWPDWNFYICYA